MAYLLLILTTLFWAGNFVIGRAMNSVLPPIVMAELRWSLALIILLPFLIPRLIKQKTVILKHWKMLTLFSILSVACFNTFIYMGLTSTNASNASILQSAAPIFILIISAVWLKERVTLQQWIGVTISLIGVLILITQGKISILLSLSFNVGDIYVLAGVLCWAIYSTLLRWRPAELDGFTFFGVTVLLGAILLLPFSAAEFYFADPIVWQNKTTYAIVYMAIFPSILAYIFWNRGVTEIGAVKAGLFLNLIPLFGLLLSSVFLNEKIYTFHIFGIILIFSGIYLAIKVKLAKQ